jgi:hypothetical protein|tara:strand:- start:368 stop:688 length:321 start_codon:yes stop_codon:yes gene_type:complete
MISRKRNIDYTVQKNKYKIEHLLNQNPKIYIKVNKYEYEQIYIDYINHKGNIIMYDNKFNKRYISEYVTKKRKIKRASAILRYIYYSIRDSNKYKLYDYLSKNALI